MNRRRVMTRGDSPQGRTSYALAVFLFAPMAIAVPLTISTAVGAASLVGERERGTGEFLASLVPGYFTTMVPVGVSLDWTVAGAERVGPGAADGT